MRDLYLPLKPLEYRHLEKFYLVVEPVCEKNYDVFIIMLEHMVIQCLQTIIDNPNLMNFL